MYNRDAGKQHRMGALWVGRCVHMYDRYNPMGLNVQAGWVMYVYVMMGRLAQQHQTGQSCMRGRVPVCECCNHPTCSVKPTGLCRNRVATEAYLCLLLFLAFNQ